MNDPHQEVPTTHEVWRAIHKAHDLAVFASFSDPDGTFQGGAGEVGRMETWYGVRGTDFPILRAMTTWNIGPTDMARCDEKHEYWLCIGRKEE